MMSIIELGALGEFVGSFGVVATLAYLSVQVRSNAKNTATEARQRVLDRFSDAKANIIGQKIALSAINKVVEQNVDFEELSEEERAILFPDISILGDNLYNAIRLKNEHVLDEEAFEYIAQAFCTFCGTPAGSVWWASAYADSAPKALKEFVEMRIP